MFNLQLTSTTMKLLPVVRLCLLTWSGITFADQHGPLIVKEGSDVTLPCSLSENIESKRFEWNKDGQNVFVYDAGVHSNGRVSYFQYELMHGNASIIIRDTTVADSGVYTCDFPRLQPRQTFHIQLVVLRRGAASKPYVTILDQTKDWSLLQCVVRGASPKPELEWRDSSGNILPAEDPQDSERGGRYDITLNITVMKTDRYRCVATQETIKHQTHAEIYVHINGSNTESNTGLVVGAVLGALLLGVIIGVVLLAVLVVKGVIRLNRKKGPGPDPATAKEESPLTPT